MAQSLPPPTVVVTPRAPRNRGYMAGMALLFIGFFVFMFGSAIAAITWFVHPVVMALLGMMLLMAGGVIAGMADTSGDKALPPPPVIQPPPASPPVRAPTALDCPNCGAPPQSIDRFGVATCDHCGTRFIVR